MCYAKELACKGSEILALWTCPTASEFRCAFAWRVRNYLRDSNVKNASTCCSGREQLKRVAPCLPFFTALKGLWKYCLFIVSLLLGHKETPKSGARTLPDGLEMCCSRERSCPSVLGRSAWKADARRNLS